MIPETTALRRAIPLALGGALLAGALPAQEPAEPGDRDRCICIGSDDAPFQSRRVRGSRARLGVTLGETAGVDGATGVEIEDVMADSPAEAAGLRDGDIVTELDGASLGPDPADGLIRAMRDVEPGDTVTVTYYREGRRRTAAVVTDEMGGSVFFGGGGRPFEVRVAPRMDWLRGRPGDIDVIAPGQLLRRLSPAGLELAAVSPALGEYFGTDRGVLVTAIADDAALGLEPGDVILAIDGREVRDPAHVRAILGSYRPDEEIRLEVIRHERRTEVSGTLR
ncbi:MAG: PDZ domain-containing protein [Longimicrobiales bacterium]|nr:PDZ domain-containing protein [Longimicrobiales bacterium]